MDTHMRQLIAAVTGNVVLAGVFLQALLYPAGRADFIVRAAPLIFVIEFLSIHSAVFLAFFGAIARAPAWLLAGISFFVIKLRAMTTRRADDNDDIASGIRRYKKALSPLTVVIKIVIVGAIAAFYIFFAFGAGFAMGNIELPLYFAITLVSKHFSKKAFSAYSSGENGAFSGLDLSMKWTWWLLISFFIAVAPLCFWERVFPLPAEVYSLDEQTWTVSGSDPCKAPHVFAIWGALYYGFIGIAESVIYFSKIKKTNKENTPPAL